MSYCLKPNLTYLFYAVIDPVTRNLITQRRKYREIHKEILIRSKESIDGSQLRMQKGQI